MLKGKSIKTLSVDHDVSRGYIYKELNNGNLKATKYGRKTIVTAEQEAEWVASKPLWTPEAA